MVFPLLAKIVHQLHLKVLSLSMTHWKLFSLINKIHKNIIIADKILLIHTSHILKTLRGMTQIKIYIILNKNVKIHPMIQELIQVAVQNFLLFIYIYCY